MQIVIENIIFENEKNGYYVAQARALEQNALENIIVTGNCMELVEGNSYEMELMPRLHSKYGIQYEIKSCSALIPKDEDSIIAYLASGNFDGIKGATARDIVAMFGMDTLEIMRNHPEELLKVRGIGKKRLETITKSYKKIEEAQETLFYLSSLGLTLVQSNKIYEKYKHNAKKSLEKNPYSVIRSIPGIGFKTAEMIASKLGFDKECSERVEALIFYKLEDFLANGHTFAHYGELFRQFQELEIKREQFQEAILNLVCQEELYVYTNSDMGQKRDVSEDIVLVDDDRIYLKHIFLCEVGIISELFRILSASSEDLSFDRNFSSIELSEDQLEALNSAFSENIFILTGGPGTGKTTILKELVYRIRSVGLKFVLAAPTGRAANRLEEVIGESASTIHRLLEYNYVEDMGFLIYNKNRENPIEADVIIVDEMSMVDAMLFYKLLEAVQSGSRLILIGDYNQLPSVSAGNVLEDLIHSGLINTFKLDKVHRQAQGSLIIKNAHAILHNVALEYNKKNGDFYFIQSLQPSKTLEELIDLVANRLPDYYKINPLEDICVLTPGKKGPLGAINLNERLQKVLNPNQGSKFNQKFLIGDKVMQNRNNYEIEWFNLKTGEVSNGVFNGEIGIVDRFDENNLVVHFGDEKYVNYSVRNSEDLVLAYAMTIHKSQGNEFDFCVIPILNTPALLKYRKLIYTGITRAKKQVTLIGSIQEFNQMISNQNDVRRNTGLCEQIKNYLKNIGLL